MEFDFKNSPVRIGVGKEEPTKKWGILRQFKELNVGSGANVFKANREGIFAGAVNYSTAPFKLSYAGVIKIQPDNSGFGIQLSGTDKQIQFYNGSTKLGSIFTYETSPYGIQIDGLAGSEVKLTLGNETRLVAKTVSSKAVIEFYGTQQIYSEVGRPLGFATDISPQTDNGNNLGSTTYHWGKVYASDYYSGDDTQGETDLTVDVRNAGDTGTTRLKFKDGLYVGNESL